MTTTKKTWTLLAVLWLAAWPTAASPLSPAVVPVEANVASACASAVPELPGLVSLASGSVTPDKPQLCQRSFCWDEGVRCLFTSTGPAGCCRYDDCVLDPTCILPDPLPLNICRR